MACGFVVVLRTRQSGGFVMGGRVKAQSGEQMVQILGEEIKVLEKGQQAQIRDSAYPQIGPAVGNRTASVNQGLHVIQVLHNLLIIHKRHYN